MENGTVNAGGATADISRHGNATVVTVSGELDANTVGQVRVTAERALRDRPGLLVLELSRVSFMGSAGLSTLIAVHRAAAEHGRLRVVAATRATLRPIEATGLDQELDVVGSLDLALAER